MSTPLGNGGAMRRYYSVYDPFSTLFWYTTRDVRDAEPAAQGFAEWTFIEGGDTLTALTIHDRILLWETSSRHYPSLEAADRDVLGNLSRIVPVPANGQVVTVDGQLAVAIDLPSALGNSVARPECVDCPWYFALASAAYSDGLWHLQFADGSGRRHPLTLTKQFEVVGDAAAQKH